MQQVLHIAGIFTITTFNMFMINFLKLWRESATQDLSRDGQSIKCSVVSDCSGTVGNH